MRAFSLRIAFVSLVSMAQALASTAQTPSPCNATAIPAPIKDLLKEKFAEWRPKQISDMDADDQQLWLNGPGGKACPGIAIGHFEVASSLSYAFLLVPNSNPTAGYKLVVFNRDINKDAYGWALLDHAEEQTDSGLVISKAEPGKYNDWEGKQSIQIRTDAIYLEWMEKGALVYYWLAGRYHKLKVSD